MSAAAGLDLRALVAETVRDVVAELVRDSVRSGWPGSSTAPGDSPTAPPVGVPGFPRSATGHSLRAVEPPGAAQPTAAYPTGPGSGRTRTETVRIGSDADLDAFARRLLEAFENPKTRQDVRAGRLRFTLAPTSGGIPGPSLRTRRIDRGAVTERVVEAAHAAGESLVLARRAVLTPLARERARVLAVPIEKEH